MLAPQKAYKLAAPGITSGSEVEWWGQLRRRLFENSVTDRSQAEREILTR